MKRAAIFAVVMLISAGLCSAYWDCEWDEPPKEDIYSAKALDKALFSEISGFKLAVLSMLRLYQVTLSGHTGGSCIFHPSCSRYGFFSVKKYGAIKGTLMSTDRVLRCNPYASGYEADTEHGLYLDPPERGSYYEFIFDWLNF